MRQYYTIRILIISGNDQFCKNQEKHYKNRGSFSTLVKALVFATLAQLVEQRIRNA